MSRRVPWLASGLGAVGLGLAFAASPAAARAAYLFAYVVVGSLSLGMLGLTMIQAMVRARWGLPIVRIFEAGGGPWSFALLFLLFLPIGFKPGAFFPWVGRLDDPRHWYLNATFLWVRVALEFGFLAIAAALLRRSSLRPDPEGSEARRRANLAAPAFVAYFYAASGVAYDFLMSLDYGWTSTIFGMLFTILSGLAAMGVAVAVLCSSANEAPYRRLVEPRLLNDYGNLLLTLLMLWGYLTYSQYIIDWSGNLKDEAQYYDRRSGGAWDALSVALIVGGFFVPFLTLQVPLFKGRAMPLMIIGLFAFVVAATHLYWMAAPSTVGASWAVPSALVLLLGLWSAVFSWQYGSAPRVPEHDPILRRVLDHAGG